MNQTEMPQQPVSKRVKNFHEISLGFSKKQVFQEAQRCPQCAQPKCVEGCPLRIDIPGFIRAMREGDFIKALQRIREQNSLSGACGRLCSAPCEAACILNQETESQPIAIKALERYAFDHGQSKMRQLFNADRSNQTDKKVAVVGSGPAGLMISANLLESGHQVTIFEIFEKLGGSLRYGTVDFHFPKKILDDEIQYIQSLGAQVKTLSPVGPGYSLEELLSTGFDAVVLATGDRTPDYEELKFEQALGVYTSEEFLSRIYFHQNHFALRPKEPFALGEKVIVSGFNQSALDCSQALIRFGKKTTLVFPCTEQEISASALQIQQAKEEGVIMESLAKPLQCIVDERGHFSGIQCLRLDFIQLKDSDEWKIVPVKDSEFIIEADNLITCSQCRSNTFIAQWTPGLKVDRSGSFSCKKNDHQTSLSGVFAIGCAIKANASLIDVLDDSKRAASEIDQYLRK